jgi:hypothetical protein
MERFQTVNGGKGTIAMHPTGTVDLRPPDYDASEMPLEAANRAESLSGGSYGTCLYLGDRGERCSRKALPTGFCARHGGVADATRAKISPVVARDSEAPLEDRRKKALKVVISLLGLAFLLGPMIADAFRALLAMMGDR